MLFQPEARKEFPFFSFLEMEKLFSGRRCNSQLWFVLLSSFLFCFVLFCFDYSALNGENKFGITSLDHQTNDPVVGFVNTTHETRQESRSDGDSCLGRYVFVQSLPSRFNIDLLENCEILTAGTDKNMCRYLVNSGLGPEVEKPEDVLLNSAWFRTNQFLLEVIFHNKMKNYECLTNDSSLASAVFVPFYAGLDLSRYLWGGNIAMRDSASLELLKLLVEMPEWKRMWGKDHFFVGGRISWDFRRQTDNETDWGSKLRFLPESKNMSMLSIESSSWNNDYAIPYPTCFHPLEDGEVFEWQERLRTQTRRYLFSFAGAPRPEYRNSIRGKIIEQCLASQDQCKLLDCNYGATDCYNPVNVMRVFQTSIFCLQPVGDSYTRRSIFDSILAGCIPVFFHPGTAYAQYNWHLPRNFTEYSVYIPVRDVSEWKVQINKTLLAIADNRVAALREEVIRLIPRVIYADPTSKWRTFEDAFDLAVKGMLERIEQVRNMIREGKGPDSGFADMDDYKYTFPPYASGVF